jgi:hypothetical protein
MKIKFNRECVDNTKKKKTTTKYKYYKSFLHSSKFQNLITMKVKVTKRSWKINYFIN